MIEGLKPYAGTDAMKRAGRTSEVNIPWLTSIPEHWDIVRSKRLFTVRKERSRPDDEQLSATQAYGVIPQKEFESRVGRKVVRITQHLDKRAHVEKGDFVISMRSFQGGLERAWATGCIRSSYVVLNPSPEARVDYFAHLFKSLDYIRALQATSNFIRDGQDLNFGNFCLVDLPLPPQDEQAAIAKFLDHANWKIDGFIRAKRKLIGLLNEQKQVIIHQAVTRGLNPDARLKPSGNGRFPELPDAWQVVALRRVIRAAIDGPHFSPDYLERGIPFLSARNVRPDKWLLDDAKFISESNYRLFCRRVKPEVGDVLYTKGGTTGVARAVDLPFPFQVWVHIAVLKLDRRLIDAEYLAYCLNSPGCYEQSQLFTRGATNQDLGLGRMKQIELPLPPTVAEQIQIVRKLKSELDTFNTAIACTEREIALVQEYRTRLTADIVTGKLDVREAAAKLPDLPTENAAASVTDEALLDLETEDT